MKSIIQAMLEDIYIKANAISAKNGQVAGEKKNYYITLEQLEAILKEYEG